MLHLYLALFLLTLLAYTWLRRGGRPVNFPPGPACLPVVGSLHQVGTDLKAAFLRWREEYGSVVGFRLGGQLAVVISDFDTLNAAFKDDRYCGRPNNIREVFSAFFHKDQDERSSGGIVFSQGDHWKEQRRFALRVLKEFGMGRSCLQSTIHEEISRLADELRDEAGRSLTLTHRTNLAVVNSLWQIINGEKSDPNNNKMQSVFRGTTQFIATNSLAGPVIAMPWLRHLPLINDRFEQSRRFPQEMRELTAESIERHRATYQPDHQRDFIDCYIKKIEETEDDRSSFYSERGEGNMQRTLMDLFGAGSETTSSILCFAFLYMIRWPEVQRRVQEEMDSVVGRSRPTCLSDRPHLPYTDAVLHEVLRHTCLVYTVPHATTEEVDLGGYTLPAGTSVYANVWWIMHDPSYWSEPERFNPERFLEDGQFRRDERCIPFMIGKRYCPGQALAMHQLFLFFTGLLQQFSFSAPGGDCSAVSTDPLVGFLHSCPQYQVVVESRH